MHDKKYFRFLILTVSAVLFCISLYLSAHADSYFDDDGYFVIQSDDFPDSSTFPYYNPFSFPVVSNNVSVPSGFHLAFYLVDTGFGGFSYPVHVQWFYMPDGDNLTAYRSGSVTYCECNGNLFYIENTCNSSGELSYYRNQTVGGLTTGRTTKITFFVPVTDNNGNIVRPESQVNFVLNTAFVGDNLQFNSVINSGDASSVKYYLFPASAPISGGSTSTVVSPTPSNQLTEEEKENFLLKGFKIITYGIDDLIIDLTSPDSSLYTTSSSRSSSLFNPDSYSVSFEYLGVSRLYPFDDSRISTSGSISIKDILSRHSGVYAYQQLKLVAVVDFNNRSFIASFDFNPSSINGGQPVAPNSLLPSADYPTFSDSNSPYKDLADYLKELAEIQNLNDKRNNNNLLSMLNAFPLGAKIAPGIEMGMKGALPELSAELDDLFDGLFDDFTVPKDEDVQRLLHEIEESREEIDVKFEWIDDVKTEVYYISSSILDAGDSPPYFSVVIPAHTLWRIERPFVLTVLDCSRIPSSTVSLVKNSITVFLSLSVVLYIWRTLPSTIGNVPKGD